MADLDLARRQYHEVAETCRPIKDDLVRELEELTVDMPHIDRIYGRIKSKVSFLRKVRGDPEKYNPPFAQVEDFIALRVLLVFPKAMHEVAAFVKDQFHPGVEDEYRQPELADQFGYEGYQFVKSLPSPEGEVARHWERPKVFEIQIKTLFMHAWAEAEHVFRYERERVGGHVPVEISRRLAWIAASAWGSDQIMSELLDEHARNNKPT